MIRYALCCAEGHAFESWFRDSAAFEEQAAAGHVACPVCQSVRVEKQIMAPAVAGGQESGQESAPAGGPVATLGPREAALREMIRHLHREVAANSEDVGARFPEEARKIHYGESDPRSIRGRASVEDARALHEEGVAFLPLPALPDDRN